MNEFTKGLCKHTSIEIIDLDSFDARCNVCSQIVTKHDMVNILKEDYYKRMPK